MHKKTSTLDVGIKFDHGDLRFTVQRVDVPPGYATRNSPRSVGALRLRERKSKLDITICYAAGAGAWPSWPSDASDDSWDVAIEWMQQELHDRYGSCVALTDKANDKDNCDLSFSDEVWSVVYGSLSEDKNDFFDLVMLGCAVGSIADDLLEDLPSDSPYSEEVLENLQNKAGVRKHRVALSEALSALHVMLPEDD